MKGNLWSVAVLACALALLVPAVGVAFDDAATQRVANESTSVDYDTDYELGQQDVVEYQNFTVRANNTELARGSDYELNETGGTLDWLNTSTTSDGDAATVNYTYRQHSDQTIDQASILSTVGIWAGSLLMIAALGYLVALLGGGSF